MKTAWFATTLTWVVTLSASANAAPANAPDAQLRTQFEAMDQRFEEILAHNDVPASLNRYSDNPIVMSPDGQRYVGRQQLEQYFKGSLLPDVHNEVHIKVREVHRSGRLAYEIGSYTWTVERKDKPAELDQGDYILIYVLDEQNTWKVHREMFTAKPPA